MNKYLRLLIAILLIAASAGPGTSQGNSDAVAQALAKGDAFLKEKDFPKAMDAYRKADKLSHHACAECYLKMFMADRQAGDLPAALDDAKRAAKAAGDNKSLAGQGHLLRAALLAQMAGKPSDKKLKEAEDETRQALALDPSLVIAHYSLGTILIRQERDNEGIAELKNYIAAPGASPKNVSEARRIIANPIRAREPFAPDFSFTTLEGQTISNAVLRGKVVLIDFWATWCGPCRASVPTLLLIRKKYLQRPVQLVGISSDENEQGWKRFIASHQMDWPEYIDLSGQVRELFDVHSYPTYVVVDRDGIIRFRQSGFGEFSQGELEEAIDKALKRPPEPGIAAAASAPTSEEHVAANTQTPPSVTAPPVVTSPSAGEADVETGVISGNVYRNNFLGLSYQFPSGWIAAAPETLHEVNERREASARARVMQEHPEASSNVQINVLKTILYVSPRGEGDGQRMNIPCIRINAMPWKRPDIPLDSVMITTGTSLVRGPEKFTVSGQDLFRADFIHSGNYMQTRSSHIQTIANGYLVMLEVYAKDSEQLEELVSTLETLSFSAH
ncbi:MAG: redoxin family protein [Terriglobia bacterium]|jgi:thiol-disulfide isomerase/thioredoxin